MHHLVGEDLPLTQEFLAEMMGVRRTSVTEVAGELQKQGLITYRRGLIHINDLDRVREHACECDEAIQSHYRKSSHRINQRLCRPEKFIRAQLAESRRPVQVSGQLRIAETFPGVAADLESD